MYEHTVDIIIGSYFFASRSCEYAIPKTPGKTKPLRLRNLVFRDETKKVIELDHPDLSTNAEFISVTYEAQKSGRKMETRSQRQTSDPTLCPCRRLGRAVQRIVQTHPKWSTNTLLCAVHLDGKNYNITNTFTRKLMRHTCYVHGGKETFGFDPHDIGNKSIRSGAAMALFMMDHSISKIMILGRWSSDAFLVYIRPQVLEWANNMSQSMIAFDSFLDVGMHDIATPTDPRTRQRNTLLNGSRSNVMIPEFNIHN